MQNGVPLDMCRSPAARPKHPPNTVRRIKGAGGHAAVSLDSRIFPSSKLQVSSSRDGWASSQTRKAGRRATLRSTADLCICKVGAHVVERPASVRLTPVVQKRAIEGRHLGLRQVCRFCSPAGLQQRRRPSLWDSASEDRREVSTVLGWGIVVWSRVG